MSRALQFVLPVFFCIAGFGQRAEAPTPPEAHVLREYKSGANQADPKLEAWLQSIYDGHSPLLAKTDAEFEQALQTWDPASSWLFRLRRNPGIADKNLAKEALAQAQDLNSQLSKHPMYPYVLQALMESPGLDAKDQVLAKNLLLERGALSCPRKKAVLQDLRSLDKASLNLEASRKYLTTLKEFSSLGFLEDSLRALFYSTHQQAQKTMRKEFADVMQPFPRLVADHGWLFDDSSAEQNDSGVLARFRSAEKEASANACAKARDTLMAGIKLDSGTKYLSLVEATAGKIEGCWRAKGDKARILFWQEIQAGLKDIYGFAGESLSERRIGLIHWGRNEFEEARKIFSQLLLKSEKEFPLVHAEALYTYARIVENEGKFDEAVQKYRFFIELYPNNEQSNQALSSLIVLSTLLKHSDDALSYA
ncbi:MAG: hypothetical protein NTX25_12750, partial [Proteobacteria bacterium]|nr:hypothetical protein [Pseudomonadota bacterium]